MKRLAILAMLLVGGCGPHVVGTTPGSVVVRGADWSFGKSLKLANDECAKHDKVAKPIGNASWDGNMNYECVAE